MIKVRYVVSVCVTAIVLAGMLWSQAMTRIEGVVKGEDGNPIQGAEIQIERTDIKAKMPLVKSGKDGKFSYPTLPKGTYDVVIMHSGVKIYEEYNVRTDYVKPIEIEVDPGKKKRDQQKAVAEAGGYVYIGLPGSKLPPLVAPLAAGAVPAGMAPAPGVDGPSEAEIAAAKERYDREMKEFTENQNKVKGLQDAFAAGRQATDGGNLDLAITAYLKAGEFDPKQDAVWANLGDVYRRRAEAGKGAQRLADYTSAADAYGKAAALKPADASLLIEQSLSLARAGKIPEAQTALDKGLALDPMVGARGYRNLGAVHFDGGKSDAAEAAYRKAIELDPNNPDAHYQLGVTLMQRVEEEKGKLKAPAGTAEAFQEYLALAPAGRYAADAKSMLEVLGAPIVNSINQRNKGKANPANNSKGKGK